MPEISRRTAMYQGASLISLSAAGIGSWPQPAHAWVAETLGVVMAAYQLYQAMQNGGTVPDLKLQLILEAIQDIREIHRRIEGIEAALVAALDLLEQMPERNRIVISEEFDTFEADRLMGSCETIITEVERLRTAYPGETVGEIPDWELFNLRNHHNTLQDRWRTLSRRSDLSAVALCAGAVVDLSVQKFFGASKAVARVTVLDFLEVFNAMEDLDDPQSLWSIHLHASDTRLAGHETPQREVFGAGMYYWRVFRDYDMRDLAPSAEQDADGEVPFPSFPLARDPALVVTRYLDSTLYAQGTRFAFERDGLTYYGFPSWPNPSATFTRGDPRPSCGGGMRSVLCELEENGLLHIQYPSQLDHACAEMTLALHKDVWDPSIEYTTIDTIAPKVLSFENRVVGERLAWSSWEDSGGVVYSAGDSLLSLEGYEIVACGKSAERIVFANSKNEDGKSLYVRIEKRPERLAELDSRLSKERAKYNRRVEFLMIVSSMRSLVTATSAELRRRYLRWDA